MYYKCNKNIKTVKRFDKVTMIANRYIICIFQCYRSSHRDDFSNYLFFFSGATFFQFSKRVYLLVEQIYFFPGGSICSSNRHVFSRRVYITCSTNRHIHIFQEGLSKKPYYLIEQKYTNFSRNPFLVLEHIQIFQEPLIFHQTDIHFPESPILSSP